MSWIEGVGHGIPFVVQDPVCEKESWIERVGHDPVWLGMFGRLGGAKEGSRIERAGHDPVWLGTVGKLGRAKE